MRSFVHRFDRSLTAGIVNLFGPNLRQFFEAITFLGDPIAVFLIAGGIGIFGYMQANMRLFLAGMSIPLTLLLGTLLKLAFERARPLTEYALDMRLQTYSFPSGHSSGSMITYGLLAYLAFMKLPAPWNIPAAISLMILPILIGISRVYLGAHFPSDVVAGWLLGIIVLILVIFVLRPLG